VEGYFTIKAKTHTVNNTPKIEHFTFDEKSFLLNIYSRKVLFLVDVVNIGVDKSNKKVYKIFL